MEVINENNFSIPVRAVLFDFDGTISTLRHGWEKIMRPLMIEKIGMGKTSPELEKMVDDYIDESTGIQTIYQMRWLAQQVVNAGGAEVDPWTYKDEYNRRLMADVNKKKAMLLLHKTAPEDYLVKGVVPFLKVLKSRNVSIYVASGTDHPDVIEEAGALGVIKYFNEIAGAPLHQENCSKEKVLKRLIDEYGLKDSEVAVFGDGKVEIALGKGIGARTAGIASNEEKRYGVNAIKRRRLIKAGADIITGDFDEIDVLLHWMNLY